VPQGETPPEPQPQREGNPSATPEITDTPATTAQLTASLTGLIHGPHTDAGTASAADLAAETIRYLNYAAAKGGVTDPATVAALTASLATAAYRLPQLLNIISEWLKAETAAGRIADDHRRTPDQLTARICAAITQAADAAVGNLTATLHTAEPACWQLSGLLTDRWRNRTANRPLTRPRHAAARHRYSAGYSYLRPADPRFLRRRISR
jgi:hypothetical protein